MHVNNTASSPSKYILELAFTIMIILIAASCDNKVALKTILSSGYVEIISSKTVRTPSPVRLSENIYFTLKTTDMLQLSHPESLPFLLNLDLPD